MKPTMMKYCITVELDTSNVIGDIDIAGYNAWDFFPSLSPRKLYPSKSIAELNAQLAYLGVDEFGVGALATVKEFD